MRTVKIGNFEVSNKHKFFLMAGPCQMESLDHSLMIAEKVKKITDKLGINYVFKASYDKANRTSYDAVRGLGVEKGLKVLQEVNKQIGVPTITDVHLPEQCAIAAEVVDIIQIPAFLCRQTDLLKAAAETKKPIHVKKMQQLAPWVMKSVVEKLEHFGNPNVMLCDRGTMFGYGRLINDIPGLLTMAQTGCPVTIDCTHSVQMPGAAAGKTVGNREFAPVVGCAALSAGIAGVFAEVHEDPDNAPSDAANMIRLDNLENVLTRMVAIDEVAKQHPFTDIIGE